MTPKYSISTFTKQEHSSFQYGKPVSTQYQPPICWPHSVFSNYPNISFPLFLSRNTHCPVVLLQFGTFPPSFLGSMFLTVLKSIDFPFTRMTLHLDQSDVSSDSSFAFLAGNLEKRCCTTLGGCMIAICTTSEDVNLDHLGQICICQVLHCESHCFFFVFD